MGLSVEDVRTALPNANMNRPKGELASAERTWEIGATDQLQDASDYQPLIVAYRNNAGVPLSKLATVRESLEDTRTLGLVDGKPAIPIIIFRQPGANIIATADRVRRTLPALQASISAGIKMALVMDRTSTIRESVRDMEIAVGSAVALVVLVVFLFLRNIRMTLIPSVAVPVSLIGTFTLMYLAGYSLDVLSLMALAIATGFVVDDAIVVIENITRHLERGMTPVEAALQGAKEIGFTVLSISISLVAVFIPILLMQGIVGRLFREFAVTLSVAIGVSLLVSLTTTPMLCARFLRSEREITHGRLYQASERGFRWILNLYETTLHWVLRHQPLMLLATLGTIVFTVYLYIIVPKGFFPQEDTGRLTGMIQGDQNTSFQAMSGHLIELVNTVGKDPAVANVVAFTGGGGADNTGRMFVALKPWNERHDRADQIIGRLRSQQALLPGAALFLQSVQDVRVGGRASGAEYQYTLQADDVKVLTEWTPKLMRALRGLPGLADLNSDQRDRGLEIGVQTDRVTAARLGVTQQAIDNTLYDAFGQRQVSTIYTGLNQYHVVMEVDAQFSGNPDGLKYIYVSGNNGQQVPLSAIAKYTRSPSPLSISHEGPLPSTTISFNLTPGSSLGDAVSQIERAEREIRLPANIHGSFSGTAQAFRESLTDQPFLILAALLAVYIVLGILYESLIHPITILSTLPSAGVGALLALLMFRTELSIMGLIGIVLLIGIVKKNAILMIDFALAVERQEGKPPLDAIYEACVLRFRPIVMTTMAALLGALPLALSMGAGSELRRPLGIAIIGGLIFSQLLTLYTTPVVYLYMDRFSQRLRSGYRRLFSFACVCLSIILLSGCAVGPGYKPPTAPIAANYKEPPPENWKEAQPQDTALRGKWWETFADHELNALVEQVNVSNQTVAASEAQFREARAAIRVAGADLFPSATVGADVTRTRIASTRPITTTGFNVGTNTFYQLPVDVSYEADVWGRVRRNIEANIETAQALGGDLESVRLSTQAELALDYFQLRGLDEERSLWETTIASFERALDVTKNQYEHGVVSQLDVAQAQTQLESARAQAIDTGVARAQFEHAIAVLIGKPPAEFGIDRKDFREDPPVIPVGFPSELLERRPDIASAERRVAAANAEIGVARAALFPQLTFSVTGGVETASLASLLSWPSRFWSLGPSLAQTAFDAGRRRALTQEAEAAYDSTAAEYRQAVLMAFQEVEDNLAALRILADEAQQQDRATETSQRSLDLALNRYRGGVTTYLDVITAQNALLANQRAAVGIRTRRMQAAVLLTKAVGGGWHRSELPSERDLRKQ